MVTTGAMVLPPNGCGSERPHPAGAGRPWVDAEGVDSGDFAAGGRRRVPETLAPVALPRTFARFPMTAITSVGDQEPAPSALDRWQESERKFSSSGYRPCPARNDPAATRPPTWCSTVAIADPRTASPTAVHVGCWPA